MSLFKKAQNQLIRVFFGKLVVPRGLFELQDYFRLYGPIVFDYEKGDNGEIIARSNNYKYGLIITSGKNPKELDRNIKDAILTSFEVPSSYAPEAKVSKIGERREEYAIA